MDSAREWRRKAVETYWQEEEQNKEKFYPPKNYLHEKHSTIKKWWV